MGMVDKETADFLERCKQQNVAFLLRINYHELCCFALENEIWGFLCLACVLLKVDLILQQKESFCEGEDDTKTHYNDTFTL